MLHAQVLPESDCVTLLFKSEIVEANSEDEAEIVDEIEYCQGQLEGSTVISS